MQLWIQMWQSIVYHYSESGYVSGPQSTTSVTDASMLVRQVWWSSSSWCRLSSTNFSFSFMIMVSFLFITWFKHFTFSVLWCHAFRSFGFAKYFLYISTLPLDANSSLLPICVIWSRHGDEKPFLKESFKGPAGDNAGSWVDGVADVDDPVIIDGTGPGIGKTSWHSTTNLVYSLPSFLQWLTQFLDLVLV